MRFRLEIELDHDAVQTTADVVSVLIGVARRIDDFEADMLAPGCGKRIRDLNGNRIGAWEVTDD